MSINIQEFIIDVMQKTSRSYQDKNTKVSRLERDLGVSGAATTQIKIKEHVPTATPVNGIYSFSFKKNGAADSTVDKSQSTPKPVNDAAEARALILFTIFEGIKKLNGISIMKALTGLKESGKLNSEEYESILEQVKLYKEREAEPVDSSESKEAASSDKKFVPYTKDEFIAVVSYALSKVIGKGSLANSIVELFKEVDFKAPSTLDATNKFIIDTIDSLKESIDNTVDKLGFVKVDLATPLKNIVKNGIKSAKKIKLEKKEFDLHECATEIAQTVAKGFSYDPKIEDLKTAIFEMISNSGVANKTQAIALLNNGLQDIKFNLGIEDIDLFEVYMQADKGEREFVYIPAMMSNDEMYEALQGIEQAEEPAKIVTVKRKGRNNTRK